MLDIAKRLQDARLKMQLILICGHNAKLDSKSCKRWTARWKMHVVGFTRDVSEIHEDGPTL